MVFYCESIGSRDISFCHERALSPEQVSVLPEILYFSSLAPMPRSRVCLFVFLQIFYFIYLFILFFGAALGLRCSAQASHCGGFSCCGAWTPGVWASVVVALGLRSCGLQALESRFSSCGARA